MITATPRRLAKVTSSWAQARTWATEPGALSIVIGPHGLDRVDDHQFDGFSASRVVRYVAQIGRGGEA